jgi:hypothetical protein
VRVERVIEVCITGPLPRSRRPCPDRIEPIRASGEKWRSVLRILLALLARCVYLKPITSGATRRARDRADGGHGARPGEVALTAKVTMAMGMDDAINQVQGEKGAAGFAPRLGCGHCWVLDILLDAMNIDSHCYPLAPCAGSPFADRAQLPRLHALARQALTWWDAGRFHAATGMVIARQSSATPFHRHGEGFPPGHDRPGFPSWRNR